jgi:hypothetical protein
MLFYVSHLFLLLSLLIFKERGFCFQTINHVFAFSHLNNNVDYKIDNYDDDDDDDDDDYNDDDDKVW